MSAEEKRAVRCADCRKIGTDKCVSAGKFRGKDLRHRSRVLCDHFERLVLPELPLWEYRQAYKPLALRVLVQGIADLAYERMGRGPRYGKGELPARTWIRRTDEEPCSPRWCCLALDWSHDRLMAHMDGIVGLVVQEVAGRRGQGPGSRTNMLVIERELARIFGWRELRRSWDGFWTFKNQLRSAERRHGINNEDWRFQRYFRYERATV